MLKKFIFLFISIGILSFDVYADMVDDMIDELKSSSSFKSRLQAAIFLGKIQDKRAVDVLISTLKDEDYAIKGACAIALGNIQDPKATQPLIELLKDAESLVRKEAVKALVKLAVNKQSMDKIVNAFKNTDDSMIKMGIITIFGELKDVNALKMLAEGLSGKGKVSDTTTQIIMGMSSENRFLVLSSALTLKDENARINAIELVGTVKEPRLIKPVLQIMRDSSSQEEIKTAKNTLKKLRDKIEVDEYLRIARFGNSKDERDMAIQILTVVSDERCIGLLLDLLKDEDIFIRGRSAQALASIGDKRAIPPLEKMLKDKKNARIFPIIKSSLRLLTLSK